MATKLEAFLLANDISQRSLARGTARSEALVSRLVSGETGASQATIRALLTFLTAHLGRPVTYEELFGEPTDPPAAEPGADA